MSSECECARNFTLGSGALSVYSLKQTSPNKVNNIIRDTKVWVIDYGFKGTYIVIVGINNLPGVFH